MKTETLFGGLDLDVTLQGGGTEKVFIRQIPVRLMPQMLAALEDACVRAWSFERVVYSDGSAAIPFALTNCTEETIRAMVRIAPPPGSTNLGIDYSKTLRADVKARSGWYGFIGLHDQELNLSWTPSAEYHHFPSSFETRVRYWGWRIGLCDPARARWKPCTRREFMRRFEEKMG